jgi:hypothetical protein
MAEFVLDVTKIYHADGMFNQSITQFADLICEFDAYEYFNIDTISGSTLYQKCINGLLKRVSMRNPYLYVDLVCKHPELQIKEYRWVEDDIRRYNLRVYNMYISDYSNIFRMHELIKRRSKHEFKPLPYKVERELEAAHKKSCNDGNDCGF